jgi:hypothetical protein
MSWEFEWITNWEAVWSPPFLHRWQRIIDRSFNAHVFFEPSIVRAWVETYRQFKHIEPLFLYGTFDNECELIWPLVFVKSNWRSLWQNTLMPVGYSDFDYHDPIFCGIISQKKLDEFWYKIYNSIKAFCGKNVDLFWVDGLHRYSFGDNIDLSLIDTSPYTDLSSFGNLDSFIGSLGSRTRENLRRKRRKLENSGCITFKVYAEGDLEDALSVLPALLDEHSKKWPNNYKPPGLHENLLRFGIKSNVVRMTELVLDGDPISSHIGFLYQKRYCWYLPVYNPAFYKFSPGQIHLLLCIEDAINEGAEIFDFLKGSEGYKKHYASAQDDLFELKIQANNLFSSARSFLLKNIKPILSKCIRNL